MITGCLLHLKLIVNVSNFELSISGFDFSNSTLCGHHKLLFHLTQEKTAIIMVTHLPFR